jgi:RNA polymerase sigma factor (sigma-70 family)
VKIQHFRSEPPNGLDTAAFLGVYDEHSEAVLRLFARRTLDPEVAGALTAETFAEAFASRDRFDPGRGDVGAWLFGIARHELGSYLRRLTVERQARERLGLPDRSLSLDDFARIEALIDFAEVGRQMRSALHHLPSEQREAVVFRVIDELTYDQIAERVGCSQQAARARVSRGLRRLAQSITIPDEEGAHQ